MGYRAMVVQRDQLQDCYLQTEQKAYTHHDALEFPDGKFVLLTTLKPGQQATVLQLPAEPHKVQPEPAAAAVVMRDLADAKI
ncbi:MAG: hypothetical protein WAM44_20475 [Chthoniobacterales bacterium]